MKKTLTLLCILCLVVAVASGCSSPAAAPAANTPSPAAGEVITWKIQGFQSAGTTQDNYTRALMKRIMELSNGRLQIEYYSADAIFPNSEMGNALRDGIVDGVNFYGGQLTGIDEAFALFTSTPGLFSQPIDQALWFRYGGGMELWQEMADYYDMNQHILLTLAVDGEDFLWSNKPIREIADMQNIIVRFMPIFGSVLADHGISINALPATEIVPGLERGVIDAGEYSTPSTDLSMGFQDVAKYVIRPGIHQPSGNNAIAIRKDRWEALPDDLKAVVESACAEAILNNYGAQRMDNITAMKAIEEAGIEVCFLSDDAVNTMNQWVQEWLEQKSETNPWMKRVVDSQKEFAKNYASYSDSMNLPWPQWMLE
ncbi:MAG: TRAP transporter substrate-binding protein DctP [Gracilibacteraceae bacterium]|jgi:TRAP-type mannitol/chloroaromatic compound transport system substrate-binding protein|nr:TRAP transporter substrate-binding protein DctP [Gracilibacteraceae bacterium]